MPTQFEVDQARIEQGVWAAEMLAMLIPELVANGYLQSGFTQIAQSALSAAGERSPEEGRVFYDRLAGRLAGANRG